MISNLAIADISGFIIWILMEGFRSIAGGGGGIRTLGTVSHTAH